MEVSNDHARVRAPGGLTGCNPANLPNDLTMLGSVSATADSRNRNVSVESKHVDAVDERFVDSGIAPQRVRTFTIGSKMNIELSLSSNSTPSMTRRGVAKAIDFILVAFTVVGFSIATHSYLAGLLIGYGWLALSDWAGSLGKSVMKLSVHDHETGGGCSAWASMVRNLPILVSALPLKLHQALLGMDRQQYREAHPGVMLSMAGVALIVLLAMLLVAFRNARRRHIGDYLAHTVVVSKTKGPSSDSRPST